MTKPKIPKKIPKERPEKINPGIPLMPEDEPDHVPDREIPKPKKPEEVPAYMPNYTTRYQDNIPIDHTTYRRYRQRVY